MTWYLDRQLKIAGKRGVGELVVGVATEGVLRFPDGREEKIGYDKWFEFVQWLYTRMDGAPGTSASMWIDMPAGAIQPQFVQVQPPGSDDE
jgi:hypothetical protein